MLGVKKKSTILTASVNLILPRRKFPPCNTHTYLEGVSNTFLMPQAMAVNTVMRPAKGPHPASPLPAAGTSMDKYAAALTLSNLVATEGKIDADERCLHRTEHGQRGSATAMFQRPHKTAEINHC